MATISGPLALKGIVTAAGRMQKTVSVTVTRRTMHPGVGKVRLLPSSLSPLICSAGLGQIKEIPHA